MFGETVNGVMDWMWAEMERDVKETPGFLHKKIRGRLGGGGGGGASTKRRAGLEELR